MCSSERRRDNPGRPRSKGRSAGPSPTLGMVNGGVRRIFCSWDVSVGMIPNRCLSVASRRPARNQDPGGGAPSASGSRQVRKMARRIRDRSRLRWDRATEADGDGHVRRHLPPQGLDRLA